MLTARELVHPETAPPGPPRVLCVDDETHVLSSLRRSLRQEPYDLLTTESPEEALDWISDGGIRLVIADQRMPRISGTELLNSTRLVAPDTLGMLLTAHPEVHLLIETANLSVRRLMFKPWDDDNLKGTIRELLSRPIQGDPEFPGLDGRMLREGHRRDVERMIEDVVVRLECRGRKATEALRPLAAMMHTARARRNGIAFVLDHFGEMADPTSFFLDLLIQCIHRSGLRPTLIDPSGRAKRYLESFGEGRPYRAIGPPFEPLRVRRHLIVDPEPARRDLLGVLVRATGGTWDPATTPDEAIHRLDSAPYDQVVLTLAHPDGPASQVGRHVRKYGLRVPILLLSPHLERWDTDDCARLGIERILPEPFRVTDFMAILQDS